jgi:DNA repair protein RadA/Sms
MDFTKWHGRCPSCEDWNSITETNFKPINNKKINSKESAEIVPLSSVKYSEVNRIRTDINEFNIVCGGGIVPGSVILIGGEPGIGKSTLALQVSQQFKTLYISGEESPIQIKQRADRLKINNQNIHISTMTNVEDIIIAVQKEAPTVLIIDSIQTIYTAQIPGPKGSVSQIKESASMLAEFSKRSNTPIVIIGHITKDGTIAGPKLLEHLVDTVLYFEGDFTKNFRMLRSFKNRYGSINEIGLFQMSAEGLVEVKDKNQIFLNPFQSKSPGNAISAAIEGSRTILFEVQSLVNFTSFTNPRRMSDGFDINRLILIVAVLEKHAGLKLSSFDVFINISGGFQINETAADLAVAMSIASSLKEIPISENIGFLGEITLSGEIRPVSQCERRIQEFQASGFKTLILSQSNEKRFNPLFTGEIKYVKTIEEVMSLIF